MWIQVVAISTLGSYFNSPCSAQEGGMGFFHSMVFGITGILPQCPQHILHVVPSFAIGNLFNLWVRKPYTYIIKHSHRSVILFLHKPPFSFPLRVGLWNKSEKNGLFSSLGTITCSPRQWAPSWKCEGTLSSNGKRKLDLLWNLFDSTLATIVTKARGSQASAISLMKSFEKCWHRALVNTKNWVSQTSQYIIAGKYKMFTLNTLRI